MKMQNQQKNMNQFVTTKFESQTMQWRNTSNHILIDPVHLWRAQLMSQVMMFRHTARKVDTVAHDLLLCIDLPLYMYH